MGVDSLTPRAVFLDRDGVINRAPVRAGRPYSPLAVSELEVLPGVAEALARLHAAGFYLIVVTNQPDVARGRQTRENVEAMHAALRAQLLLHEFRVCYHDDADGCGCRKPAPGMLLDAARAWRLNLMASFMVGDQCRDVQAGQRAGCTTVLVDYGYADAERCRPDVRVSSFAQAAEWILGFQHGGEQGEDD